MSGDAELLKALQEGDPSHPLPALPEAHVDPSYARGRAEYFQQALESMEQTGIIAGDHESQKRGYNKIEDTPQYQSLVQKIATYTSDASDLEQVNYDYDGFIATANLATAAYDDHRALQTALGFGDLDKELGSLSAGQRETVGADLAAADVDGLGSMQKAEGELRPMFDMLHGHVHALVGAGRSLSAFMLGNVIQDLEGKLAKEKEQAVDLKKQIASAGSLGDRIESGLMGLVSFVTMPESAGLATAISTGAASAEKGVDAIQGNGSILGGILSMFESTRVEEQLQRLETDIKGCEMLIADLKLDQSRTEFAALQSGIEAAVLEIRGQIGAILQKALEMRRAMEPAPKPSDFKHKGQKPVPKPADDPAKDVERFVESARTARVLVSEATPIAGTAMKAINDVYQTSFAGRTTEYSTAREDADFVQDERTDQTGDAEKGREAALKAGELHEDEGVTADDDQTVAHMMGLIGHWLENANDIVVPALDEQVKKTDALKAR